MPDALAHRRADDHCPPAVSDRRLFERWRAAQAAPPGERWAAFARRDDLPPAVYAFAASAVYSSNIEGIDVGLGEFLESKTRGVDPPREKARAEVAALEAAYAFAHETPLTEATFLAAHDLLGEPTLIPERRGRYRTDRMAVYGPTGIVYVAVEPEHVAAEMAAVFAGVAGLLAGPLAPDEALYHAALLHLVVAHVHPFADGNGRAARLLEKWFLASALGEAAWAVPSEYGYWMGRPRYYAALRLGVDFYNLDYDRGGPDGTGAVSFLSMLPDALSADQPLFSTKALGEVGQIVAGGTPSSDVPAYWGGDIAWCTPTDITTLGGAKYIEATERTITDEGLIGSAATLLPPGSLVVCTRATVGDCAINTVPMATNQGFKSVVPYEEDDAEYLYYVMRFLRPELERLGQGGTFDEVSKRDFERFEVPFPPVAQRHRIAGTLATWDRALDRLDALLATLERRQRGLMQRLLSGADRFPEFAGQPWARRPLGQVGRCIRGVTYAKHSDLLPSYEQGAYVLLRANNISGGLLNYKEIQIVVADCVSPQQIIRTGDMVICMSSGSADLVGKAGQYLGEFERPLTFGAFCSVFRTNEVLAHPAYIHRLFQSDAYQHELASVFSGTSINNLKGSDVERFKLPLPSLAEQRRIAAVLDAGAHEIAARRAERDALARQQRGLMQRLLTGRLRVPA